MASGRGTLALVAGMLALLAGGLASYARFAVLDEQAFADRATATLTRPDVTEEIALRVTDRAIEGEPGLAAARPALEQAVGELVADGAFAAEFHAGAARLHHVLFYGGDAPPLDLPGAGDVLHAAVARRSPAAATLLGSGDPNLLRLGGGPLESGLRNAAPLARRLAALAPFAYALAAVAFVVAIARAPTRRIGVRRVLLAVAGCGAALALAIVLARLWVLATFTTPHGDAVVSTIWGAYLDDLRLWSFVVAGAAALGAAAVPIRKSRV